MSERDAPEHDNTGSPPRVEDETTGLQNPSIALSGRYVIVPVELYVELLKTAIDREAGRLVPAQELERRVRQASAAVASRILEVLQTYGKP